MMKIYFVHCLTNLHILCIIINTKITFVNSDKKGKIMKPESKNERIILHSDMNNFYASVECRRRPELKGKFVAVCGSEKDRHGIVLAKNESAKKLGVKTGEPIWQARLKCPNLVIVEPDFDEYLKFSNMAKEIYCRYTDLVEPFGLDECWLDVSGSTLLFGSGRDIAYKIKEEIKRELGLTVSIGVSFNKVFAKLGSDLKKPDAVTCIPKERFREILWGLDANSVIGIGPATDRKLRSKGIVTIGDLANTRPELLKSWLGINGIMLWNYANGRDFSEVAKAGSSPPIKSIGHGVTCTADLGCAADVWKVMFKLTIDVSRKLRRHGLFARGISVSVKNTDLKQTEFQSPLRRPARNVRELSDAAFKLFNKRYNWEKQVRAVSVRAINLCSEDEASSQISMFDNINRDLKRDSIETALENIRKMYGKNSVTYARLLGSLKLPNEKNINPVMPGFRV